MPRLQGPPTKSVTIRVPTDLLDRIDQDITERGKRDRTQWFVSLAAALLDNRLMMKPKGTR